MVEFEEEYPAPQQSPAPQELPPRNFLEYAAKMLQANYSKRGGDAQDSPYRLLDIDLVLSNLTPAERDAAAAFIEAVMSLKQLERAVQEEYGDKKIKFAVTELYDLRYCFQIESTRGLEGKTLDAVTKQRIEQSSTHKEMRQGDAKKPWYRSVV